MDEYLKIRDTILGLQKDVEATFAKGQKSSAKRVRKATSELGKALKALKNATFIATGEKTEGTAATTEAAPQA